MVSLTISYMNGILIVLLWSSFTTAAHADDLFYIQQDNLQEIDKQFEPTRQGPSQKKNTQKEKKNQKSNSVGFKKLRLPPSVGMRSLQQTGGTIGGDRERVRKRRRRERREGGMPPPPPPPPPAPMRSKSI